MTETVTMFVLKQGGLEEADMVGGLAESCRRGSEI